MSYAATAALQAAIYARLQADQALADLVGDAIYGAGIGGRARCAWPRRHRGL